MLPADADVEALIRIDRHILGLNIDIQENERSKAMSAIERRVRPLIGQDPPIPRGRIRASSHDINADFGFPLTEAEVEAVLVNLLYQWRARVLGQRPKKRPRRNHG